MSSRVTPLLFVAWVGACTVDDVPIIEVAARAQSKVVIGPAIQEPVSEDTAEYRWELLIVPDGSIATAPVGTSVAEFTPDLRGVYGGERWLTYGLTERITHRFVIIAEGLPPTAKAQGPATATVGSATTLDAGTSASPEHRPLTYYWRLTERPRDSVATLDDTHAVSTSFVPDQIGTFRVELSVFDGELWSMPTALTIQAQ